MRFNIPVFFQRYNGGEYNESTGNYDDGTISEEVRLASVVDTTEQEARIAYGGFKAGSKTITVQNAYTAPYDCIRIGLRRYQVDLERRPLGRGVYVCSEVL